LPSHAADDASAEPKAPARLGRYELLGQLATGGMAEIHLARLAGEAGFEKIVVVKRLLPELVASKAFVAMFLDEGKLVARLSHPNVCEVHELGRDGAEYFLVMPYLDGVPATDFIARPRDPDRIAQLRVAAGIVTQACAGLHHAHEAKGSDGEALGLVHRDISPSNVFVTADGIVKVLDFGIAKVRGAAETEVGTIKGKTQYMAPEQLLGEALDRRADLFAVGILLYELATHQRLFKRASEFLAAKAILEEPIPRADSVDPAIPAPIADVIAKALSRVPSDRYATARELGAAIESAFATQGGVARPDEISAALAEWHGAELTAMRTRQAAVIGDARTRASALATNVVERTAVVDTSALPTKGSTFRRNRFLALLALALVGTGIVGFVATRRQAPVSVVSRDAAIAQAPLDAAVAAIEQTDAAVVEPEVDAGVVNTSRPPPRAPGFYSVESKPFATIFIDGTRVGITPLVKKPLAAGKHKLRAVLEDGRERTVDLDVPPGKAAKPLVLVW